MFRYEIYLDGELIDSSTKEGIALLKLNSANLLGEGQMLRVYDGPEGDYDPVLHGPARYNESTEAWEDAE